jgi:CDP-paratose 2-epimerase
LRVLITGGAGFIGANLADALAAQGAEVLVFDNLSRSGVEVNWEWLRARHPGIRLAREDVRDAGALRRAVRGVDRIYHFASQVAVTTSVTDPRTDFEINLLGAFNALEAARVEAPHAGFFFTSTNKVYGGMEDVAVERRGDRYEYVDLPRGIAETHPLDFHSPYGCSKGGADQYVRDYHRIYGLPTVVFRMSCIYGPLQRGNEDQGWVAHFARRALDGGGLSIYGDGRQVRDILYVGDLVRAFLTAGEHLERTAGRVYNIGGGAENTVSLRELIRMLEERCRVTIPVKSHDWRPGDQRIYVSDIRRAEREFGWRPRVGTDEGVGRLVEWLRASLAATAA